MGALCRAVTPAKSSVLGSLLLPTGVPLQVFREDLVERADSFSVRSPHSHF